MLDNVIVMITFVVGMCHIKPNFEDTININLSCLNPDRTELAIFEVSLRKFCQAILLVQLEQKIRIFLSCYYSFRENDGVINHPLVQLSRGGLSEKSYKIIK